MPPRIAGVSFADAVRVFQQFGWEFSHQQGSHYHMVNADGVYVTLTRHGRRDIDARLLGQTVEDAGINPDEFLWGWGGLTVGGRRAPRGLAAGSFGFPVPSFRRKPESNAVCQYDAPGSRFRGNDVISF